MSNQSVLLRAAGLYTYPNQLSYNSGYVTQSSMPIGALTQADDVVINRDNVIEPRRGFDFYGTAMGSSTSNIAKQLFTYKERILRHWGSTIEYDNGSGTFTACSASVNAVVPGLRIKSAESNSNLYFTTNSGIQKISVKDASGFSTGSIVPAGMPEGLDITLSLNSQTGFFNQESVVAYRVLWGVKDANSNLILGSPSNRQIIYNPLTPLLVTNFNALLQTLDTLSQPNGIHYRSYYNSFKVTTNTNSTALRSNLIAMVAQLDTDIEKFTVAGSVNDVTGTTSGNTISVGSATGILVGQSVSVDPTVVTAGPYTGTTTLSSNQITSASSIVGIQNGQIVTCTASGVIPEGTTVISSSGTTITLSSLPLVAGSFSFNFTNPNPFPAGTTVSSISGTTITLNNSTTFSGTYTNALNFNSLFSEQASGSIVSPNTPAASTSTSTTDTSYNVTTVLTASPSSILQIGDPVILSGITPTTFNQTGIVQSISGNAVTFNVSTNPGPYLSGTGTLARHKYEYLTQPETLSSNPLTNELLSLQTYYSSIVSILQNEPTAIVGTGTPFVNSEATQTATVNITFPIPAGITTQDFYQIYRTQQTASNSGIALDTLDPGDEEYLAYEGNPASSDLTNGYVTVQDIQPDSYLGASLYTNANSGTGITSANVPPPLAQDMTLYYNYMFYANTQSYHSLNTTLLGVTHLTNNVSTLTISNGTTSNTYTFTTSAEDPVNKKIHISSLSTPAQQINETARSIVNVINRNPNEIVYAFYESGPTDVPGKILFQARNYGQSAFTLTVDSTTTGSDFNPALPTSGSTTNNTSDNDARPNRLFYSTQYQPDAVPIVNYIDIGPQDKSIVRILGLRQSLFILKEEGIYRLTGDTSQSFAVALFDSSTFINAPDSAAVLNNTIYCLSNQGIVNISDNGVSILSRPIEGTLLPLTTPQYTNFASATFGVGYESDRTYNLWTVTNATDIYATQSFRYNTVTQAWTRCTKTSNCAVINSLDDKMYVGATDINYIEQERKNFDRTDYADRSYALTIIANGVTGSNVSVNSVSNCYVGDALVQTQYLTIAQFNRLLSKLDNDIGLQNKNYVSTLTANPGANLRTSVTNLATALDSDAGTQTKTYSSAISGFGTTFQNTQDAFNTIIGLLNGDLGVAYKNYVTSSGTVQFEINIVGINTSQGQLITAYPYPFIEGPITAYNHIDSQVQWSPQSMGDPSMSKHVSEGTVIFNKMSFTDATLSFSTDLVPGFEMQDFPGMGNGSFGNSVFGNTVFGDSGNAAPLRTYIPRDMQRCRFMNVHFEHAIARETYAIYGLSLTFNMISTRAWR